MGASPRGFGASAASEGRRAACEKRGLLLKVLCVGVDRQTTSAALKRRSNAVGCEGACRDIAPRVVGGVLLRWVCRGAAQSPNQPPNQDHSSSKKRLSNRVRERGAAYPASALQIVCPKGITRLELTACGSNQVGQVDATLAVKPVQCAVRHLSHCCRPNGQEE